MALLRKPTLLPSGRSRGSGNFDSCLGRKRPSASLTTLGPPWSLARVVLNLPRRDSHDMDRVADHIGGALLAFGASRH